MMRVLMLVVRSKCCSKPSQQTCCSSSRLVIFLPASSRPMTPRRSAEAFSAVKLRATLAAPPGMKFSRSKSTTGTGASGEMRETRPQTKWSSITSPTTSRWRLRERAINSCTRLRLILTMPSKGSVKEGRQGTGWTRGFDPRRQSDFERGASGFDGHLECHRHPGRVTGNRDGGVHERGVGAHFHRFRAVTGRAQSGIDDDRHGGLLDDDANLVARLNAAIGA